MHDHHHRHHHQLNSSCSSCCNCMNRQYNDAVDYRLKLRRYSVSHFLPAIITDMIVTGQMPTITLTVQICLLSLCPAVVRNHHPVTRTDQPGRRTLRSADTNRLLVPPVKLSTVGSRAFPVAGPRVWNALPDEITSSSSQMIFCRRLKAWWLFRKSFPDISV